MRKAMLVGIVGGALALMSGVASASGSLSPKQCDSYPFVRTSKPVTQRQIQRELAELESVGYRPSPSNSDYPYDIESAEHRLRVEYRRDCPVPDHASAGQS